MQAKSQDYAHALVQANRAQLLPTGELGRFCTAIGQHFCVYSAEFNQLWTETRLVELVGWENRLCAVPESQTGSDCIANIAPWHIQGSTAYLCWQAEQGLQVKFEGRLDSVPLARCLPYWRHHMPVINNNDLALLNAEALFVPIRLLAPQALETRSLFEQRDLLRTIQRKLRGQG